MRRLFWTLFAAFIVIGCNPTPDDGNENNPPAEQGGVFISALRATDSTIAIGWTTIEGNAEYIGQAAPNPNADYTEDIKKSYKVALYNSTECTRNNLVVSVEIIKGSSFKNNLVPPRFVFAGLNPSTDYYVKVFNLTDGTQNATPVKVSTVEHIDDSASVVTKSAKAGDLIAYQDFSGAIYGGDISTRAAGVSHANCSKMTSISTLRSKIGLGDGEGYIFADAGTEIELFTTLKGIIDDMGLDGWGWYNKQKESTGSIFAHPGYITVGSKSECSAICTPALYSIPLDNSAKVKVCFKAAPYCEYDAESVNVEGVEVEVAVGLNGAITSTYATVPSRITSSQRVALNSNSTEWREYSVTLDEVLAGSTIIIGGAEGSATTNRFLLDDIRVYIESLGEVAPIGGTIYDQSGNPVSGVVVSNGFSVTKSDASGRYTLPYNGNAKFIFYTTPAQYEVAIADDGYPLFYKSATESNLDFTLGKKIEKQREWHLYVMADPQTNQTGKLCIPYFERYMAADIKQTVARDGFNSGPTWNNRELAYGMVLGDIIWNSAVTSYMESMKNAMSPANTSVSWFTVPGNHDWYSKDSDTNPSLDCYHSIFGPSRYSFDRGDVHIVGMNNTITGAGRDPEDYGKGFTADEFNWLKEDLAQVPKDKCVVLCVHIPFFDGETGVRHCSYYTETLNLLKGFANAYIFSGHNHYSRHWFHPAYGDVHEINHGAACGLYWNLKLCGDGTPAGYYIYTFEGNDCKNHLFKAAGTESYTDGANALRMYLGTDSADLKMVCGYGKSDSTVFINLYNGYAIDSADSSPLNQKWKIELYYQGAKVMDMVNVTVEEATYGYHNKPSDYISNYSTWSYHDSYLRNDADWWLLAQGLPANSAIKNRNGNKWGGALSNSGYKKTTTHIYAGSLPESVTLTSRDVMVVATAPTGQVYRVDKFTSFSSIDGIAWEKY